MLRIMQRKDIKAIKKGKTLFPPNASGVLFDTDVAGCNAIK